jgi:hypothetical protein
MHRVLCCAVVICLASAVSAASVHFVRGPVVTDAGVILVVEGKLAGLGEGDITVLVNATGIASVECTNPGGNVAPGQDTAVSTSGSITLPSAKNGHLTFAVATAPPVVPDTPTCPNDQWSAGVTDVAFTGGTLTVIQGGEVVLTTSL